MSNNHHELKKLAAPYDSVETACIELTQPSRYEHYIRNTDVVIRFVSFSLFAMVLFPNQMHSLLPAHMHHEVAAVCISARKPLVTASYTSSEMERLDSSCVSL